MTALGWKYLVEIVVFVAIFSYLLVMYMPGAWWRKKYPWEK